ncbi:hypothetical protein H5410_034336 [Solanum commersonii]|uniref:Uncharacterized protein n=1 Tax=Solanum commersonii TaxID=4109 RepID=A0A9J5YVS2_SOLCO|nr:hypothetical protein H5410_034336 [Solanum commersonii]
MKLNKLIYYNEDLVGGANQQGPNDQDVAANADQVGGANDHDGAVNELNEYVDQLSDRIDKIDESADSDNLLMLNNI